MMTTIIEHFKLHANSYTSLVPVPENYATIPELCVLRDEGTVVLQANLGSVMQHTKHITVAALFMKEGKAYQGMQIWIDTSDEASMQYMETVIENFRECEPIDEDTVRRTFQMVLEGKVSELLTDKNNDKLSIPLLKGFSYAPQHTPAHIASFVAAKQTGDWNNTDPINAITLVLESFNEFHSTIASN